MAASEALGDVRRASVTKLAGATLGVHLRDDNEHGVMVDRISASTSDLMWLDSELKKGDVILSVNGASAIKAEDVARIIGAAEVLRFEVQSSAPAARGSSAALPRFSAQPQRRRVAIQDSPRRLVVSGLEPQRQDSIVQSRGDHTRQPLPPETTEAI